MAAITICSDFGAPKIKSVTVSTDSPSICHKVMGPDAMILVFWMLSFKPTFSLSSFTFIKRLLSSSSLSAIRVVSSAYLRLLIIPLTILFQLVLHPAQRFAWLLVGHSQWRSSSGDQMGQKTEVGNFFPTPSLSCSPGAQNLQSACLKTPALMGPGSTVTSSFSRCSARDMNSPCATGS